MTDDRTLIIFFINMVLTRKVYPHQFHQISRFIILSRGNKSITGYKSADDALKTVTGGKIYKWLDAYENVVGLTEVKQAQALVTEAEAEYRSVQEKRRSSLQQLTSVQAKIKVLTQDIEKAQRGTDAYIELVTQENEIIKTERQILEDLNALEELEKHHFGLLSSAVRESHEKERARAERVKYWGLSASVIGAVLGIMGTTVNNYLRMKELRKIVSSSSEQTLELYETVNEQYAELRRLLTGVKSKGVPKSSDAKSSKEESGEKDHLQPELKQVVNLLHRQETLLKEEIESVRKLLSSKGVSKGVIDMRESVVYASADLESVLKDTEKSLEWKMKLQALGIVTLVYAVGAITVPIVMKFFSGGN